MRPCVPSPRAASMASAHSAASIKNTSSNAASRVNDHPWLADLVIWRARRSPRILRRMTGVLEETQNPGRLFSLSGMTKLMFE